MNCIFFSHITKQQNKKLFLLPHPIVWGEIIIELVLQLCDDWLTSDYLLDFFVFDWQVKCHFLWDSLTPFFSLLIDPDSNYHEIQAG